MCALLPSCAFLGTHPPLAAVRGKAVGAVSLAYFCDGPCGMRGEPRGKSGATPQGWVCVVVDAIDPLSYTGEPGCGVNPCDFIVTADKAVIYMGVLLQVVA